MSARRVMAYMTAAAMAMSLCTTASAEEISQTVSQSDIEDSLSLDALEFSDVRETAWYYNAVNWGLNEGITSGMGDGTFGSQSACTRAQIVTFLWNQAGQPTPVGEENPFYDVEAGAWYYNAVLWAVEQGITAGMGDGFFGTNEFCTRAQAVTFLWNVENTPAAIVETVSFTDVYAGEWYYDAVLWASEGGITAGLEDGSFGTNEFCTRAQIVQFLYNQAGQPISQGQAYSYISPFVSGKTYTVMADPQDIALGIDVSYYQGSIDWEAVADAGVEFAFIRAAVRYSLSGTMAVDSMFYENIEGALNNGIKVGLYIFSQAVTEEEVLEEADLLLSLAKGYDIDLPLIFDPEFTTNSKGGYTGRLYSAYKAKAEEDRVAYMTGLADTFFSRVEKAGYTAMYYSGFNWLHNQVDASAFANPVWLARYNTMAGYLGEYAFWQYTSSGHVDGILNSDGSYQNVDCNFCLDRSWLNCNNPPVSKSGVNSLSLSESVGEALPEEDASSVAQIPSVTHTIE